MSQEASLCELTKCWLNTKEERGGGGQSTLCSEQALSGVYPSLTHFLFPNAILSPKVFGKSQTESLDFGHFQI